MEEIMYAGKIHHLNLDKWWHTDFSQDERDYMKSEFGESLDVGSPYFTKEGTLDFLSTLAPWFLKDNERTLAYRILGRAESYYSTEPSILAKHFYLQSCIEVYYRGRSDPESKLDKAIEACKRQIALAPEAAKAFLSEYPSDPNLPTHKGFKQLCIIFSGQGRTDRAIETAQTAFNQGWRGDWERRIQRYTSHKKS